MGHRRRDTGRAPGQHPRVLLHHAALGADGTVLHLCDHRSVRLDAVPDRSGSARVRAVVRRVLRVDIVLAGDRASATVRGLGHRRECVVPVSLGSALALAVDGEPTIVRIVEPEVLSA